MRKNILIINDDISSCQEIEQMFQDDKTKIMTAHSLDEGLRLLLQHQFFLIVLDISLSRENSLAFLSKIQDKRPIPILILSGVADKKQKYTSLQIISRKDFNKPYSLNKRLDYAESLMQSYIDNCSVHQRCYTMIFGGNLVINPMNRQVLLEGEILNLTRKEFDLLFCLASHAGQVLSRQQLYQMVWNENSAYNVDETVKAHIKTLRKKLTPAGAKYIKNVWGIGYRFSADENKE